MNTQNETKKLSVSFVKPLLLTFVTMVIMSLFTFGASAKEYTYTVTNGAVYNVKAGDVVNLIIPDSASGMAAYAYYWYAGADEETLSVEKDSKSSLATFTFKRGGEIRVP